MTSDFPDSTDSHSGLQPRRPVLRGKTRAATAGLAWVETGVFVETTPAGHLACVVGPGELIQGAGFWLTDGRYREADLASETAEERARRRKATEQHAVLLKARLDCLMSHSGVARLADLLATIHAGTHEKRLVATQQELAALVGQRRATVNEGLQALQDRKIVVVGRGRVDIHDIVGLTRAACGCESGHGRAETSSADG